MTRTRLQHNRVHRTRVGRAGLVALVVALGWLAGTPAGAQEADGVIAGQIVMGTAGATLDESALQVRLIVLEGEAVAETVDATITAGRYEARVPAVLSRTYVPVISYRGIQYFVPPAILDPSAPEVVQDVTVYETTTDRPDLTIESTTVTLIAIDREAGQMGLVREDLVRNPTDRVYVGDDRGVTMRVPAPEGTLQASGDNPDGTFTLEAGAISVALPIRPLQVTSVVTRTLVQYEVTEDEYALRLTAPLSTDRVAFRVPEGFLGELEPDSPAARADDETIGEGDEATTLQVVAQEAVGPGQSLLVTLGGFTPDQRVNALTEVRGAVIAALVALAVVGGAVIAGTLRRRGSA